MTNTYIWGAVLAKLDTPGFDGRRLPELMRMPRGRSVPLLRLIDDAYVAVGQVDMLWHVRGELRVTGSTSDPRGAPTEHERPTFDVGADGSTITAVYISGTDAPAWECAAFLRTGLVHLPSALIAREDTAT